MEYEQLEVGSKTILRCIHLQDVAGFADLLSPFCVLITHFPPSPSLSTGSTAFVESFRYRISQKKKLQRLLEEQAAAAMVQQERFQEHLRRLTAPESSPLSPNASNAAGGSSSSGGEGAGGHDGPPAASSGTKPAHAEGGSSAGGAILGGKPADTITLPAMILGKKHAVGDGKQAAGVPSAAPHPPTHGRGPTTASPHGGGGVGRKGKHVALPPPIASSSSAALAPGGGGSGGAAPRKGVKPLESGVLSAGMGSCSPTHFGSQAGGGGPPSQALQGGGNVSPAGSPRMKKADHFPSSSSPTRNARKAASSPGPTGYLTTAAAPTGGGPSGGAAAGVGGGLLHPLASGASQRSSSSGGGGGGGNAFSAALPLIGRAEPLGVRQYFYPELSSIPAYEVEAAEYHALLDISDTPLLVMSRFYELLAWMGEEKYIAEPKLVLHPRKGILQDNEILPPPPTPHTLEERLRMLGKQYTERNQPLSYLTITWGRESLLFHDAYYFLDGRVITIHRCFVPLREMMERVYPSAPTAYLAQQMDSIKQVLLDFYKEESLSSKGNSTKGGGGGGGGAKKKGGGGGSSWRSAFPLLDFSFADLDGGNAIRLLQVPPLTGQKHIARGRRPEVDPRLARGVFLTDKNDPTTKRNRPQRTLIKAKSKKGEEEAYEFDSAQRVAFMDAIVTEETEVLETVEGLSEVCKKYDANAIRISSCMLQDKVDKLALILRGIVANAFITICSLDLSDNQLTSIPPLLSIPLQKLFLHGNLISDWQEVEERVCPLPFVRFFTLHGNPIAKSIEPLYWPCILSRMLRHPHRLVRLKQLDFVTLTAQDYHMAGSFDLFQTGNRAILEAEKEYRRVGERTAGEGTPLSKGRQGNEGGGAMEERWWSVRDKNSFWNTEKDNRVGEGSGSWSKRSTSRRKDEKIDRWRGLNSIGISVEAPRGMAGEMGGGGGAGSFSLMAMSNRKPDGSVSVPKSRREKSLQK